MRQLMRQVINDHPDAAPRELAEIAALRININRHQSLIDKMQAHGAKTVADLLEQKAL